MSGGARITLAQTLTALEHELYHTIAPELHSTASRDSLRSIMLTLRSLAAAADPSDSSAADMPYGCFGGEARYRAADVRLQQALSTRTRPEQVAQLLAWEKHGLDRTCQQLLQTPPQRPPLPQESADGLIPPLQAQLRQYYPEAPALTISHLQVLAGGRSKLTARLQLEHAGPLPAQVVLRQDRQLSVTGGPSVTHEYALLDIICAAGVRVPRPLLLHTGADSACPPFILMELCAGAPASELLEPPHSAAVALQLAEQLARLHQIPLARFSNCPGIGAAPARAHYAHELQQFSAIWQAPAAAPSLSIRYALDWLGRHLDLAVEGEPVLVHRDPLFHNVLASGDTLTGLLDWEFARSGYAAEDFGWIRAVSSARLNWETLLAAYHRAGGPPISRAQMHFYSIWGGVRLLSMIEQASALVRGVENPRIDMMCVAFHDSKIVRAWLAGYLDSLITDHEQPDNWPSHADRLQQHTPDLI
jgi:aminoglycoside phosphotransferase (APT) family kinase protein